MTIDGRERLHGDPVAASVRYTEDRPSVGEIIDLFRAAGLNGPLDEPERVKRMVDEAQYLLSARLESRLVGLVRVLTDFSFNAFIADLAVLPEFQRRGIGSELLRRSTEPFPGVKFVVHPGHESAGFYRANGFSEAASMVRMRVQ